MRPWTSWRGLVVHTLVTEVWAYVSLARWLARRPHVPAGSTPWGYARLVSPVTWLWIGASAAETVAMHLIVPWEPLRLALLVLSVWGLVWMLGMLGGLRTRPHLVDDEAITLRQGCGHVLRLPWVEVADARAVEEDLESSLWALQAGAPVERADGSTSVVLSLAVSGRTNVLLALLEPRTIDTRGGVVRAHAVAAWVDEPRAFVAEARSRAGGAPGGLSPSSASS
ncbi:hypothetical protein [Nocardioides sp. GY 10127]|uniref:hypothetical protein n=1 Tax=Nocardioides sp. GY 10127 TaxID=2569762 RepID=UPI0010A80D29|nr:hypothetical protein [Nocardioides sp. GY 10127]TIC83956.1 hypothetical protein E8D37_03840 [Nocardioides sp. GY 10127]